MFVPPAGQAYPWSSPPRWSNRGFGTSLIFEALTDKQFFFVYAIIFGLI